MIDIKIHEDTVSTVNEFLVSNEQFGDDWREEKTGLNDLLAEIKRLNKFERFVQWVDAIHHEGGDIGECWETEVLKVLGEEE